jgi:HD-GYP domain-containing protein (c-di-GMP phosphodiesterase class II)
MLGAFVFHRLVPLGSGHLLSVEGAVALTSCVIVTSLANAAIMAGYMGLLHESKIVQEFESMVLSGGTMVLGAVVLSTVMLGVYGLLGVDGLLFLVVPIVALHVVLGRSEQRARIFRHAVDGLSSALAVKDRSTYEHSRRVGEYAASIGETLQMSHAQVQLLYFNGLMHDIGKLGVEDEILLKPSRFTTDEYQRMKSHASLSEAITRPFWDRIAGFNAVSYHHERWDGRGYPRGLSREAIPLQGRILAVADSFDAMTADRPYHAGIPDSEAYEELIRCAGTQFDPEIVRAFLESREAPIPSDYDERVRRQVACAEATGTAPGATVTVPQPG